MRSSWLSTKFHDTQGNPWVFCMYEDTLTYKHTDDLMCVNIFFPMNLRTVFLRHPGFYLLVGVISLWLKSPWLFFWLSLAWSFAFLSYWVYLFALVKPQVTADRCSPLPDDGDFDRIDAISDLRFIRKVVVYVLIPLGAFLMAYGWLSVGLVVTGTGMLLHCGLE